MIRRKSHYSRTRVYAAHITRDGRSMCGRNGAGYPDRGRATCKECLRVDTAETRRQARLMLAETQKPRVREDAPGLLRAADGECDD